jgi:Glutaredoxin and related proteins
MYFTVFGKENCPYCVKAKALLQSRMLEFTYKDVKEDEVFFMQMNTWVTEATGAPARTVPQIFVDKEYIGGHDDLVEYLNQPEEINPSDYFGEL